MISVLALIEEVGIIGMSLFMAMLGYVFWGMVRGERGDVKREMKSLKMEATFMIAVLTGLCFHAQFEGWWISIGSYQFFLFFTVIGCALGIISPFSVDRLNN